MRCGHLHLSAPSAQGHSQSGVGPGPRPLFQESACSLTPAWVPLLPRAGAPRGSQWSVPKPRAPPCSRAASLALPSGLWSTASPVPSAASRTQSTWKRQGNFQFPEAHFLSTLAAKSFMPSGPVAPWGHTCWDLRLSLWSKDDGALMGGWGGGRRCQGRERERKEGRREEQALPALSCTPMCAQAPGKEGAVSLESQCLHDDSGPSTYDSLILPPC